MTKFDKSQFQTHSDEEIKALKQFCKDHGIIYQTRECYFTIGETHYRLSPHAPHATDRTFTKYKSQFTPTYKKYVNIKTSKWNLVHIYTALSEYRHPEGFEDIPLPEPVKDYTPLDTDMFIGNFATPHPEKTDREKRASLKGMGSSIKLLTADDAALIELAVEEKPKRKVKVMAKPLPVAKPQEEEKPEPVQQLRHKPTKQEVLNSLLKKKR